MEIAREEKPGVGKEKKKESHTGTISTGRWLQLPNQLFCCLPTQTVFSGASKLYLGSTGQKAPTGRAAQQKGYFGRGSDQSLLHQPCAGRTPVELQLHQGYVNRYALVRHRGGYCWTKGYAVLGDVSPRINSSLQHSEQGCQRG